MTTKIVPLSGETIGPISLKKVETYAYICIFPGHPPTPRGGMGGKVVSYVSTIYDGLVPMGETYFLGPNFGDFSKNVRF